MQNFLKSIKVVVPLVLALLLLLLENGQQRTRGRRNHIPAEGKEVAVLVEDNVIFIGYVVFLAKIYVFLSLFFANSVFSTRKFAYSSKCIKKSCISTLKQKESE